MMINIGVAAAGFKFFLLLLIHTSLKEVCRNVFTADGFLVCYVNKTYIVAVLMKHIYKMLYNF